MTTTILSRRKTSHTFGDLVEENLRDVNYAIIQNVCLISRVSNCYRDLDPKNVMWKDGNPYLIDWEAAGYVNPYQELLEVLNYWADDGNGQFIKENFDALYNSYKNYNKCSNINWDDVIASGYGGMLGWLDYSFKRSLGIESHTEEEIALGTNQVLSAIKTLLQYEKKGSSIKSWLSNNEEIEYKSQV